MPTPTLSKLKFKAAPKGRRAYKEFGTMFVSIGYNPTFNKDTAAGGFKGDGRSTWEIAYGPIGSDADKWTVVCFAHRANINAILRNVHMQGIFGKLAADKAARDK